MAFSLGSQEADTNGTTHVAAVSAPASGVTRQVSQVVVCNIDTVAAVVHVHYDNGSVEKEMYRATLQVGESLTVGGFVLDSSASIEVDLDAAHTTTAPTIVSTYADFS
jgi:hypothetical protein